MKLDKIAGILLIALLAIVLAVSLSYYVVSQPNLNHSFTNAYANSSSRTCTHTNSTDKNTR
jgi:hypothetical protein